MRLLIRVTLTTSILVFNHQTRFLAVEKRDYTARTEYKCSLVYQRYPNLMTNAKSSFHTMYILESNKIPEIKSRLVEDSKRNRE